MSVNEDKIAWLQAIVAFSCNGFQIRINMRPLGSLYNPYYWLLTYYFSVVIEQVVQQLCKIATFTSPWNH